MGRPSLYSNDHARRVWLSTWEESGPETGEAGKRLAEDSARRLINEEDEEERREAGVGVLG